MRLDRGGRVAVVAAAEGRVLEGGPLSWLSTLVGVLSALACGATGALLFLRHARQLHAGEVAYGIATPHLPHLATATGAITGAVSGVLLLYFTAVSGQHDIVWWIGQLSYVLIAASSGAQVFALVRLEALLRREESGWGVRPPASTLGARRRERLAALSSRYKHYLDLKTRDDEVVRELVGVLGTPLLNARRDQSRIPYYGYLGTVCGILLMAQELGRINEATEAFKVLKSMASGLVLAFQTTLVGLMAFLPLRKAADHLVQRLSAVEERWLTAREDVP